MSLVPFWFVPSINYLAMCQCIPSLVPLIHYPFSESVHSPSVFHPLSYSLSYAIPHDIISCSDVSCISCLGHHRVQSFYSICDQSPILMSHMYDLLLVDMS